MSSQLALRWRLAKYFAFLIVLVGSSYSTFGQPVPGGLGFSKITKAVDPSSKGSSKSPLDPKSRQAFKEAIENGNAARSRFEYEKAFASYRRASELDPNDAGALYGLGNVYYDLYCYDSAIDLYNQAVKLKPDFLNALVQLGYSYVLKERFEEAGTQFGAALMINPKNLDARLGQLYVDTKKQKYKEAIEGINRIINDKSTAKKDQISAYIALGDVFVAQKRWPESIAPYEKARQLNPDLAVAYLKLGMAHLVSGFVRYDLPEYEMTMQHRENLSAAARLASENLRTAMDVKHYDHPNGYLMLAMALMYQSNYQGALSKIDAYLEKVKELEGRLISLDSRLRQKCDYAFNRLYADGYSTKGYVREREALEAGAGKDELIKEAIVQYKKAIEVKQDYAGAYTRLGTLYFGQRDFQTAIEYYKKSLLYEATESNKATLYGGIGSAYAVIGPVSDAINYLNRAIEIDPTVGSHYTSLAQAYAKQGNLDEAIRLQKESIARQPKPMAISYSTLAGHYFTRGTKNKNDTDYEEAIKLLNEAIRINRGLAVAYLALGNVYKFYKNGANVDDAIANYEKAKEYGPQNPSVYFLIGDLHASVTHNYDAAIKYLNEAIRLKPDYSMAYWTLALVYRDKKDDNEAIKHFLEGLKYQKDMNAYVFLADTLDRQKKYDDAIKWLLEAVRLEPENHSPYFQLARVYTHQRKNEEAIQYYEQAISRLKRDDLANKNLYGCRIVRLRRQYPEALACFEKLNYPFPDQVPYEIGVTHLESGNKQSALSQHQKLVQLKSPLAEELLRQINEMK